MNQFNLNKKVLQMKLSKKFILSLILILVANNLFAQIEKIDNHDKKGCIENKTFDVKKALIDSFDVYFTTNYPMYFDKGFVLKDKVYIFNKKVKNPIDKKDYVFCNTIKSKKSIQLSQDVTKLMFEYYHLNKQIAKIPAYKAKYKVNPFELNTKNINKESLSKLNQLIFEITSLFKFNDNKEMVYEN